MAERHYKNEITAFVDHELPRDAQHEIAEHLMQCADCRAEHDRIRFGASLAATMQQVDAPTRIWNKIADALDGGRGPQIRLMRRTPFLGLPSVAGYAVGVLVVAGLVTAAYLTLFRSVANEARTEAPAPTITQDKPAPLPEVAALPVNTDQPKNANPLPANSDPVVQSVDLASIPSWQVETITGNPTVGSAPAAGRLAVGDFLETDAASRARITVANIGNVEIQPNSRVKLVGTNPSQHRLSLERGTLQAKIAAPPRLFIVDTPSAVAVDLGCEYKLEVDRAGNSRLHVTSGFVALERGGRESIVPAGAICLTMKGKGLGTPFAADTTEAFRTALERFDFSNGGSRSVETLLAKRGYQDMITLWHLLPRVSGTDRGAVYDALAGYVTPPEGVTRKGILSLDKTMLDNWRAEVEEAWFNN